MIALFFRNALMVIGLSAALSAIGASTARHPPTLKARVRFLATGTSIHSGLGTSQDVYLVDLMPRGSGEAILARLIDEYPPYRVALSSEILKPSEGTTLKVRRDDTCDTAFGLMPLRTAPGDPMAILPNRLGYQPHLSNSVRPEENLPCYRVVR